LACIAAGAEGQCHSLLKTVKENYDLLGNQIIAAYVLYGKCQYICFIHSISHQLIATQMKKLLLTLSFCLFLAITASAQTVVGQWKTIDDETGKEKSIVELYEKNGKLYGKIIKLFRAPNEDQDPKCDLCTDDRKNQKIIGMDIVRDMEKAGGHHEWEDGTILDPKKGKIYDCEIWLDKADKNKLHVRGYVAFFFRTQNWYRVQ
jgi:uncharacterized protein (DUF2147 family)